jgi:hypothetical protein
MNLVFDTLELGAVELDPLKSRVFMNWRGFGMETVGDLKKSRSSFSRDEGW